MAPCKFYPFFVIVKTMVHPSINDNLYFIKTNFSIWSMYMYVKPTIIWVQFSSVNQSCPTLCDPMNHSNPSLPVHHQLLEFTKTHVHWVGDAIQPSPPLSMASPTRWTWVWASFRSRWWTGTPGMLQSMGSQRVGHDWATELMFTTAIFTNTKKCKQISVNR